MATKAEQEAINKVKEILGEHFPAFVVITLRERIEEANNVNCPPEEVNIAYDGGFWLAKGLAHHATDYFRAKSRQEEEE